MIDKLTRNDVVEFIQNTSMNLFGKYVDEIAELIADEVLEEYNEAGDGKLQKAVSYVIIDKFGGM